MKPISTLIAALTCAALLGLYPGSVIAQAASDTPAVLSAHKFKRVPINPRHSKVLCSSIDKGSVRGINAVANAYSTYNFTDVAMSADCEGSTALRYAFQIQSRKAWKHMIIELSADLSVVDDDGLTIRDYIRHRIELFTADKDPRAREVVKTYREYLRELDNLAQQKSR